MTTRATPSHPFAASRASYKAKQPERVVADTQSTSDLFVQSYACASPSDELSDIEGFELWHPKRDCPLFSVATYTCSCCMRASLRT